MKALKIKATDSNPNVHFDPKKEKYEIRGNSMPENASSFYKPIIDWLDCYADNPTSETEIAFQMDLLNTSSTKMFIDLFRKINKIFDSGLSNVNVLWYYNYGDDDIQGVGVEFKDFCKAPFELVAINN